MKMLVVLALSAFVAAEPEADAAFRYTTAFGAYPYAAHAGVYGYPYVAPVAYRAHLTYTNVAAVNTYGAPVAYGAPLTYTNDAPAVTTYDACGCGGNCCGCGCTIDANQAVVAPAVEQA